MTTTPQITSLGGPGRNSEYSAACKVFVLALAMAFGSVGSPYAQTGPGGVDDTDATNGSDLQIWLQAGQNVTTNGSGEVTGWENLVGETAATAVNGAPTLESGQLNGEPAVRFNEGVSDPGNVTDYLDFTTPEGGISGENTIVVVSKNSGGLFSIFNQAPVALGTDYQDKNNPNDKSPDGRGLTYSLNTQTGGDEVALGAVNGDASGGGNEPARGDVAIDLSYNVTPFSIYSSIAVPGNDDQDLLANGTVLEGAGNASGRTKSTARVGERLIGDVAEVIVLDKQVNAAERTVLHNYLSTKYGISLGSAVSDKYRHDSGHPGEVAGVGRANGGIGNADKNANLKQSAQSSGLFLNVSGSLLAPGEYVLYGHDNANLSFTAVETPNGRDDVQKLAREWRVDSDNNFTSESGVNLGFDESALPASQRIANTSYNDYFVFVDPDGDFSDGNATGYDLSDADGDGVYTVDDPNGQSVTLEDGDYVTVARIKRKINVAKKLGSGFENVAGTVSLKASLNFETNQTLTVDAPVDPVTSDPNLPGATEGTNDDYEDLGASWFFTANDPPTATTNVFDVKDDNNPEDTELLKVTLGALPSNVALGDTTRFEYSIIDDDSSPEIEFASSNPTSVTEGDTTVTFNVETLSSSGSGTAFFKTSGDATAGEDYEIASASTSDTTRGEVSVNSGNGTFDITILDDNVSEASENLEIEFYAAKNATLVKGGNLSETLTIDDDDGTPSVNFASDSYSGEEGTEVDVTLSLSASAGQDLDVKIEDKTGSGEPTKGGSDPDYEFSSPKTVTIPSGNTTEAFSVSLLGDGRVETTEDIKLSIVDDGDTEPTVSTPNTTTISILDNSAPGKVGPGGVGSADEISLWLRPDEGVTTDASGVNSWADQSGNGNDATQTDDTEKPAYGNTTINGIKVVTFDGSDDFLRTNIESLPSSDHALFSVSRAGAAGAVFGVDDSDFDPLRTLEYDDASTASASQSNGAQDTVRTSGVGAGGLSVLISEFDLSSVNIRAGGTVQSTGSAGTNANGTYASVGAEVLNSTGDPQQPIPEAQNPFGGELGEIIAYNQTLNKAQRLIVENYLAAKYSIGSLSSDLYAGDLGADGTDGTADDRDRRVIGVGQASDGTKHFSAQGGGITLTVNSGNDNGDFVFAGRKTGVTERVNITDTSTAGNIGVTSRINEDRYIDVTGAISVDITFNFADSDIIGPAGDPSNYVLLRRGGTSGDWTKVTAGASSSSEAITFAGVSLAEADGDDGYYTVGTTDHAASPLDTRYITVRGDAGTGNDAGYYHFSAPTDGSSATFGDLVKPDGSQVIDFSSGNPNPNSSSMVQTWDPVNQTWTFPGSGDNITTGKGFVLWLDDTNASDRGGDGGKNYRIDPEYTFGLPTGAAFEKDNVTVKNLSYCSGSFCSSHGSFYLLGNPYLEAFDLDALNLDRDVNGDNDPDFQQAVIVWDARQSSYIVKTRGTSDDDISRWQGFFIQRNTPLGEGATQLTFDNSGRVSSLEPFVGSKSKTSSSEENDWARVALALTAQNGSEVVSKDKAAVLLFHEQADAQWDAYDLPKRGGDGASLAIQGIGQTGSTVPKAQESRALYPQETYTVDLQFEDGGIDGAFEISPHQWENIPSEWTITLIDTKGTSSEDDDEHVVLDRSKTYQFDVSSTSETPRFQIQVEPSAEALPVELSSIDAVIEEKDAILEWKTASETNNSGFEVQHKTKGEIGSDFKTIGFVEGEGTTAEPQSYRYRVEDLGYGEHVFRLRQVDQDGSTTLSKEAKAQVRLDEAYSVSTPYPNPFRSRASMDLTVREAQDVQVALFDVLGRQVKTILDETLPAQETRTMQFTADQFSAGVYFLRVKGESFSEVRKIIHVE